MQNSSKKRTAYGWGFAAQRMTTNSPILFPSSYTETKDVGVKSLSAELHLSFRLLSGAGIALFELVTGETPWSGFTTYADLKRAMKAKVGLDAPIDIVDD